jgi:hypothetical protein
VNDLPPDPVTGGDLADALLDSLIEAASPKTGLDAEGYPARDGLLGVGVAVSALSREDLERVVLRLVDRLNERVRDVVPREGPSELDGIRAWRLLVALDEELDPEDPAGVRAVLAGRRSEELREVLIGVLGLLASRRGDG